jgi:hypothetical protein
MSAEIFTERARRGFTGRSPEITGDHRIKKIVHREIREIRESDFLREPERGAREDQGDRFSREHRDIVFRRIARSFTRPSGSTVLAWPEARSRALDTVSEK